MQVLEQRVPVGPCSLSIGSTAALVSPAPCCAQAVSSVAARSVIGPRTDCVRFCLRAAILLLLERAHAEHQPGDAVVLVELHDPLGEPHRLLDIAVGEHRQEGALEQFGVASDRRAARRGNRRRRRRHRAACRRGGRRDSCRTPTSATVHARRHVGRDLSASARPAARQASRQKQCSGAEHDAGEAPERGRNNHDGCLHGRRVRQPLRVGRRMAFLRPARKDGTPRRRMPAPCRFAMWQDRDRMLGTTHHIFG